MIYAIKGVTMPTVTRSGETATQATAVASSRPVNSTEGSGKTKPRDRRKDGEPVEGEVGHQLDLKA